MLIYSENFAGILNQITAVFTRRQVNIESLNVCASSTPGVHKYTITYTSMKILPYHSTMIKHAFFTNRVRLKC